MKSVIIITGASGTLGKNIIRNYLNKNNIIFYIYNKNKEYFKSDNVVYFNYDLSKNNDYAELIQSFNKITSDDVKYNIIFYHCAGIYIKEKILEANDANFYDMINIHSKSFVDIYIKIFPFIKKANSTKISLINTNLLRLTNVGSLYYNMSKSMQREIVRQIAYENGEHNILINSLMLGFFKSNLNKSISKTKLNSIKNNIPLHRIPTAKEISKIIVRFTESNSFITGENIVIDGGNTLGYQRL